MQAHDQLTLSVLLDDEASFDNFHAAGNEQAWQVLQQTDLSDSFYFFGLPGVGKSHLLQAACSLVQSQGGDFFYVSLKDALIFSPDMLYGLDALSCVALDDVDAVIGQPDWEEALFHCYNGIKLRQGRLLLTGQKPVNELPCVLPDLASRLSWGVNFQLKPLIDSDKVLALALRAHERGLYLGSELGDYLLTHYSRDMQQLNALLAVLDKAALHAKRRLTIPFVKMVIASEAEK